LALERLEDRMLLQAGPANIRVNDPQEDQGTDQDTQSETSLVAFMNSGNVNVVVAYNDSGSAVMNDKQFTGYSTSTNGGATFTDQGTLPVSMAGDGGDPSLARYNGTGRIYLATLLGTDGSGLQVFRSDNNGQTFMAPVNGAPGHMGFLDKEWLTVDNTAGAAGYGNVYMAFREFSNDGSADNDIWYNRSPSRPADPPPVGTDAIWFTRSTDNGATWSNPGVQIATAGEANVQGAWVAVGPDHAVYVFWYDTTAGTPGRIMMRKSTDQGQTFAAAVPVVSPLRTTGVNGDLGLTVSTTSRTPIRSNAFPQVVVRPSNPSHLYLVYNDKGAGADKGDVFLVTSTNGGMNWGAPVRVNNDTTNDQWSPTLAITPDGSKIGIFWYDRRFDPNNSRIQRLAAIGTIAGNGTVTFERNRNYRITNLDNGFPPLVNLDRSVKSKYMGDYDQAVAFDNNSFFTTWGDNRDDSVHNPARKTANVYFASVSTAARGLQVIDATPMRRGGPQAYAEVQLTFSQAVDPTTLTLNRVSLTDPYGNPISVQGIMPVSGSNGTQFDVLFPLQSAPGTYTVDVSAYVSDVDGYLMDQDLDGGGGDPLTDSFEGRFTISATTHLLVSAPSSTPAGAPFSLTVSALDQFGNIDPTYTHTIHFTSTDSLATLPDDYAFTAVDGGSHTFSGVVLQTLGNQTITATDTQDSTVFGSANVFVFQANALWYNGDFDGRNGLANEANLLVSDARTYDNFIVPTGSTWDVLGVFSHDLMDYTATTANWEIRSGVSVGNGGTLVASGANSPATQTATGNSGFGYLEYEIAVSGLNIVLPAGEYWLNVTPIGTGFGQSFVSTTSGANAIGLPMGNDGNGFFDSTYFGYHFADPQDPGLLGPGTWDFSMGVRGNAMATSGQGPSDPGLGQARLGAGLGSRQLTGPDTLDPAALVPPANGVAPATYPVPSTAPEVHLPLLPDPSSGSGDQLPWWDGRTGRPTQLSAVLLSVEHRARLDGLFSTDLLESIPGLDLHPELALTGYNSIRE
jgi:hypothetical protein